ncbi:MAG TPA: NRDE family protein, partial [Rhodocyclaceae bacterium]|nr:NRDE family protein [Rhodocyclaceae bacterium]
HPDEALPSTGVGLDRERELSSIFVATPVYGTRSSAVLRRDTQGRIDFSEQTWEENGVAGGAVCITL